VDTVDLDFKVVLVILRFVSVFVPVFRLLIVTLSVMRGSLLVVSWYIGLTLPRNYGV